MSLSQEEIAQGASKMRASYFKKAALPPGESTQVTVVDVEKNHTTKFPITGENYCWRFLLSDERVWDEATGSLYGKVIKTCYPDGKTFQPATFKISKLVSKPAKGSQYTIDHVKTT